VRWRKTCLALVPGIAYVPAKLVRHVKGVKKGVIKGIKSVKKGVIKNVKSVRKSVFPDRRPEVDF